MGGGTLRWNFGRIAGVTIVLLGLVLTGMLWYRSDRVGEEMLIFAPPQKQSVPGSPAQPPQMSNVANLIRELIQNNKVVIFAKSYCPYCRRAKELFSSINEPFRALELDQMENGAAIQDELQRLTDQRTVPNIFINGKHVGGFDKTSLLQQSGELVQLLGR